MASLPLHVYPCMPSDADAPKGASVIAVGRVYANSHGANTVYRVVSRDPDEGWLWAERYTRNGFPLPPQTVCGRGTVLSYGPDGRPSQWADLVGAPVLTLDLTREWVQRAPYPGGQYGLHSAHEIKPACNHAPNETGLSTAWCACGERSYAWRRDLMRWEPLWSNSGYGSDSEFKKVVS